MFTRSLLNLLIIFMLLLTAWGMGHAIVTLNDMAEQLSYCLSYLHVRLTLNSPTLHCPDPGVTTIRVDPETRAAMDAFIEKLNQSDNSEVAP